MRETLADSTLARYAGRFVWLALDFDNPANQAFVAGRDVAYTPSLFVIDPEDERATATHIGGMTLGELNRFLDQGERGIKGRAREPADAALARGDEMVGRGRLSDAAAAYREALRLADLGSPQRVGAVRALTWALLTDRESRACAETSAAEAPSMPREPAFASVVLSGLVCSNQGAAAPWAEAARKTLEPLAAEAAALPTALRDDRFQLYQQLMHAAQHRGDAASLARWGGRWLDEIEATVPGSDDERSALDIARVDAVALLDTPARALPALAASERAMPGNYNASLRLAQVATAAKRYDEALAACERGLAHVTGPLGRSWLLQTEAEALVDKGDAAGARRVLEEALVSARAISTKRNRDSNVERITRAIEEAEQTVR
jgi:tetratricopeptide (TPR) repeat protein